MTPAIETVRIAKIFTAARTNDGTSYGVERVCVVWEQARSTFYDRRERAQKRSQGIKPGNRGPRPLVPDAELLDRIRHDLTTSPFPGEGDCKVWGVHRHRALERRVRRMARLQARGPVCSPGAHQPGVGRALYGAVASEVSRGLLLRMDHGSTFPTTSSIR
jgi:hypothetical protein